MENSKFEIERKWLINNFPDLPVEDEIEMEQSYLSFKPVTVRIRKEQSCKNTEYILCVKSGSGLIRRETEINLTPNQYDDLKKHITVAPVKKLLKKYRLPSGHILECSLVDEGEESCFFYAEVEFESEEDANSFSPPSFLQNEVTNNNEYTMAAYFKKKYNLFG